MCGTGPVTGGGMGWAESVFTMSSDSISNPESELALEELTGHPGLLALSVSLLFSTRRVPSCYC